jgi:hypothetical protein
MAELSLDQLFAIAEASPALDRIEAHLRASGNKQGADALVKLQQDAGLEIDNEMTGSFSETPSGPQTAALMMEYQPVTQNRVVAALSDAYAGVTEDADKKALSDLIRSLGRHETAPAAAPKPKP